MKRIRIPLADDHAVAWPGFKLILGRLGLLSLSGFLIKISAHKHCDSSRVETNAVFVQNFSRHEITKTAVCQLFLCTSSVLRVACELHNKVADLTGGNRPLPYGGPFSIYSTLENLHVTLLFLGEVIL